MAQAKKNKVLAFLGVINYYRAHINNFGIVAVPLLAFSTKKSTWPWEEQQQEAFEELRKVFIAPTPNTHVDFK